MTKDGALQMCLEYIETNAHERRFVRWAIKEALAQPERQPLTDEQIDTVFTTHSPQAGVDFYIRCRIFARAIEAAHNIGAKS